MNQFFTDYCPPNEDIWQLKEDPLVHAHYAQKVQCLSMNEQSLPRDAQPILLGFASDAGIIRCHGRAGAKDGPEDIRRKLAPLCCHHSENLLDIGDIQCNDDQLETAQEQLAQCITRCHEAGHPSILLGGGNEMAWPHFKGLSPHYAKLGMIHLGPQFHLSPVDKQGRGNSNSAFLQIADFCRENKQNFSCCCLGIQDQQNSHQLFEKARELQMSFLRAEEIQEKSIAWQTAFLDEFLLSHDHIYLSISLDVFAECTAPGVSAPQSLGISPWQALALLHYIVQTEKVISIDVAELSPALDQTGKTGRLAAVLIAKLLEYRLFRQ